LDSRSLLVGASKAMDSSEVIHKAIASLSGQKSSSKIQSL